MLMHEQWMYLGVYRLCLFSYINLYFLIFYDQHVILLKLEKVIHMFFTNLFSSGGRKKNTTEFLENRLEFGFQVLFSL